MEVPIARRGWMTTSTRARDEASSLATMAGPCLDDHRAPA